MNGLENFNDKQTLFNTIKEMIFNQTHTHSWLAYLFTLIQTTITQLRINTTIQQIITFEDLIQNEQTLYTAQ